MKKGGSLAALFAFVHAILLHGQFGPLAGLDRHSAFL